MATKQELAASLARELAEVFSTEVYGKEGPPLDTDIDEIEDNAVLAAQAAFDAVIAKALVLQNQNLPREIACPRCQRESVVKFEERTVQGRMGPAAIQEPVCHCSVCDRDFFPAT